MFVCFVISARIDGVPRACARLQVEDILHREAARVAAFLNPSSEAPLLRVVERELLAVHQARLLDKESSGLRWLLRNKRKEDLARMCVGFLLRESV